MSSTAAVARSYDAVPAAAGLGIQEPVPPGGPSGILDLRRTVPVGDIAPRCRAQVSGVVTTVHLRHVAEAPILEIVVADGTGEVTVSFFGREALGGVAVGGALTVEGMVLRRAAGLAMLNPAYDLRRQEP